MAANANLFKAKNAKQDEFYTQLTDIEKELRHYRKHFKGKTILCNCDDPYESNFFKYFALNFNRLGINKLIATSYSGSLVSGSKLPVFEDEETTARTPYKAVVTSIRDATGDGGVDMLDVAELFRIGENTIERLKGDGSYDSEECLKLLDEADIVVTNPPFSIFRSYVSTLLERGKKFIIVGNMNALKYKEMFPLLKENLIWLGNKSLSGGMDMIVPDCVFDPSKVKKYRENAVGEKIVNIMGVCWFTNLDIKKRHEEMILVKRYRPEDYPTYDNYDAIEVSKVADIPCNYPGKIGVPITFFDKYNPDQFEIIDCLNRYSVMHNAETKAAGKYLNMVNGKAVFARVVIKNRCPE